MDMNESPLSPDPHLVATAYHEAGHAVMALSLGRPIHKVSIVGNQSRLGHCQIQKGRFRPTKDWLEDEILILYAGMVAEAQYTGNDATPGATSDLRAIRYYATQRASGERQVDRLERRLFDKCEHHLTDPSMWQAVESIARELLRNATLSGRAARHFYEIAVQNPSES